MIMAVVAYVRVSVSVERLSEEPRRVRHTAPAVTPPVRSYADIIGK